MKGANKSFSRIPRWGFILIIFILIFVSYAVAHNKTVVIPLFDSESSTSQTQYFVVGGEAFTPGSNEFYSITYGCGGAYMDAPGGAALVAPVHLPHGAEVIEFKVFFSDTSTEDMTVNLQSHDLAGCSYSDLASVISSGTAGYYSQIDNTISSPIIDNRLYSYHVFAYSDLFGPDLRIKGAVITYTTE